jgi:hypothetical protein
VKQLSVLAASLVVLATAGFGFVTPAAAATPAGSVSVSLSPINSGDIAPGEVLRLFLTLTNSTAFPTADATATISVASTPLTTRSALADWFSGKTRNNLATARVATATVPATAAGLSSSIAVDVPSASVPFGAAGVYVVSASLASGQKVIGTARTAIAWNITAPTPLSVAVAAPLTVPASVSGFLTAQQLATYTAPGGVLTRELGDVQDTQVAVGIDPRIIASIRILGKNVPATAKAWYQELLTLPNQTFPLAWADADVTAPLHAGEPTVLGIKPLDYAIDPSLFPTVPGQGSTPTPTPTGQPVTPTLPTTTSLTSWNYTLPQLAWPAENSVVSSDLPKLHASGLSAAILSSTNLSDPDSLDLDGASAKSGDLALAVSDAVLSGYLRQAIQSATRASSTAAITELTTTLALMSLSPGETGGPVLLTLGPTWWSADANFERTLSEVYARNWDSAVELSAVIHSPAETVTLAKDTGSASRIALVQQMLAAEKREVVFSPVAKVPEAVTSGSRLELLSVLSNEWVMGSTAWTAAANGYVAEANKTVNSVQVAPSSTAVALADQIAVPVTINNDLDQDVTINLAVRPTTTRVSVDKDARSQSVTVDANSQRRVLIPLQALSNGNAEIVAALTSITGVPIGQPVTIKVNVQAGWETVGTLVFAALIVALFAFGIIRNIRKRRKARRGEANA